MAGLVFLQWKLLAEIRRRTGLAAAMVLYRRPPQNPHPAALDDVVTAIRSLHTSGALHEGHWVMPSSAPEFVSTTSNSKALNMFTPYGVALPKRDGPSLNRSAGCVTSYLSTCRQPAHERMSLAPLRMTLSCPGNDPSQTHVSTVLRTR